MSYFTKLKCRQCGKFFPPKDLICGICPYCWQLRAGSYDRPGNQFDEFKQNGEYVCAECRRPIGDAGVVHYIKDAAQFAFLCFHCFDTKFPNAKLEWGSPLDLGKQRVSKE